MRGVLLGAATVVALVPLVLILYYLFKQGPRRAGAGDFFTTDPTGNFLGDPGGIKSAILGTIEIVALAAAIAIPIGIGVALYLVEYGKQSRFARGRPLLHRRDDRRAVDRLRPVHLHHARRQRVGGSASPAGRARSRWRC